MTATSTPIGDPMPRWDLTGLFGPTPDGHEALDAEQSLRLAVFHLQELYDRHDVHARTNGTGTGAAAADQVAAFDEVLTTTNQVLEQFLRLNAYAYAHVTANAGNDPAQQLLSRLQAVDAELSTLRTRFEAWVDAVGAGDLVRLSDVARDHAWALHKGARRAVHLMSEPEEGLAAALGITGATAWTRLYDDVTAGITATVEHADGREEALPIFAVRGLATSPDHDVREAAYRAELVAWDDHATPIAAALNAIKGETLTVDRRRGWDDPLDPVLEANAIDRRTLDTMNAAVDDVLDDFRRYLFVKAEMLGKGQCTWFDLAAPVGEVRALHWAEAVELVGDAFAGYSPDLAGVLGRALDEWWIDAGPRRGKVGGAFCLPVGGGASRVLMNYDGSIDAMHTIAHELGHAFHNQTLRHRTPVQRSTPRPLAETASTFCETILTDQLLARATSDAVRLAVLEASLHEACQLIVDIRSRFLFETRLFERRRTSTVGVAELCALMDMAQAEAYGEALDPSARHPYMWAAKPHYYSSTFYNWPYTFGLLFGLGLYARWREDPERFRPRYEALLASTGLAPALDLAAGFGIDLHDPGFWRASLDVIRVRIDDYATAAAAFTTPSP
jgi:pepF/M3 family oligoendopeptidase